MKFEEKTIGSIVAEDFRAAGVFEKYHLDFCCGGKKKLQDACAEKGIDSHALLHDLASIGASNDPQGPAFNDMNAAGLMGYIVLHYHFSAKNQLPLIQQHLDKVAFKHGERFPYMVDVAALWRELTAEMLTHMEEEERLLFPALKSLEAASNSDVKNMPALIHQIEDEHEKVGALMHELHSLTNEFTPPEGACTTFRISMQEMAAFELELHQHVHLENNILFPRFSQN